MSWQNNGGGGGPWGGGGSGGGSGGSGGPGNNNPWGRGGGDKRPPDIDDMLRKGQDRMKNMLPGGFGGSKGIGLVILAAVGVWLASGFYRVEPDQQGVVTTFGRFTGVTAPGLNWHWPSPIQSVDKPSVTQDRLLNVTGRQQGGENLMLTGDENIVNIDFNVLWRIKDAPKFLFTAQKPDVLIAAVSESVVREIIGQTPIQSALTEGRGRIETSARDQIQGLVDSYNIGVEIRQVQLSRVDPPAPVVDAFNDVQRARSDRERTRNEAEAYRNDIIPRARGEAERMLQEAQAYREEIVNRAQGDAQRFLSIYETYKVSKDVTSQRLYIEAMEEILARSQKIVIEPGAAGQQGVLPYLPLPELRKPASPAQGVRQ
ncbi:FtsH protease activity modulator HflK [Lacibacterium aquatile]|uniref:Protein HflK n=1 Tax=Lacibacterium aquatile TaxID=1168082 RepID=A0ABW5DK73_9PROT